MDRTKNLSIPPAEDKGKTRDELKTILRDSMASDTNPLFKRMSQLARLKENIRYS